MVLPDMLTDLSNQLNARIKERVKSSNANKAQKELKALETKKTRLLDLYLSGDLEKGIYIERAHVLDDSIQNKKAELSAMGGVHSMPHISPEILRAAFTYYLERYGAPDCTVADKLVLLNGFVDKIILFPDHIRIVYKIKGSDGEPIESKCLTRIKGAFSITLDIQYRIHSYSLKSGSCLFMSDDFIDYSVNCSNIQ